MAAVVTTVALSSGCGGDADRTAASSLPTASGSSSASTATPTATLPSATSAPTPSGPPPAGQPAPPETGQGTDPVTNPPVRPVPNGPAAVVTADASCAVPTLSAAVKDSLNGEEPGQTVAKVAVLGCRNGYARVVVTTAGNGVLADPQLFLRRVTGAWQFVGRADAGLDCGDTGLPPAIATACSALTT
ncbi:hypothetical protein GCM10027614_18650 [Micromonospora vulcania]